MIGVKQTRPGGADVPAAERGDCWDACLASLLEVGIEHMTVNPELSASAYLAETQRLLAGFGYSIVLLDTRLTPPGYWIASVDSKNIPGGHHVVVMHGSQVAWDPGLGRTYKSGRRARGARPTQIREAYVLVPLDPAPAAQLHGRTAPGLTMKERG